MTSPEASTATGRLDRAALSGAAWMASAKWSAQLATWASTIVVARVLAPSDYGLVTMASVFLVSLSLLSEFGIGIAIVSMPDLRDDQLEQLNALSVLLGIGGSVLTLLASVPLGYFFREPALPPVLALLGLPFIITAFQVVPAGLLRREMRFPALAMIDVVRSLVGAGVTLAAALGGFRYWSLVLGTLTGALLGALMTLRFRQVGMRRPRLRELTRVTRFSRDLLVARLSWIAYQEGDFAVAARRLGAQGAGIYGLAWTIAMAPLEKVQVTLGDVTPTLFGAVRADQQALRRYFCNLTELLSLVMFPAAVGLACVSRDLVAVALGAHWHDAALPLALLALCSGIRGVSHLFGILFTAVGEVGFMMRRALLTAALLIPGFVVGSHWGPAGIAAAWLTIQPMLFVSAYPVVRRTLHLPGLEYLRLLRLGFDGTVVMAASVLTFSTVIATGWGPLPRLVVSVALGAATFVAITLLLHGQRLREILAWVRRMRSGTSAATPLDDASAQRA